MSLSHARIYRQMIRESEGEKIVFFEIPLFSKCPIAFDWIWFIKADKERRVLKIMERDGTTRDRAERLVNLQSDEEKIEKIANYVIRNEYEFECLKDQVLQGYYFILEHFS